MDYVVPQFADDLPALGGNESTLKTTSSALVGELVLMS